MRIQANQAQQATDELQDYKFDSFKFPKDIHLSESQGYVCICIRSRDNAQGTKKIHTAQLAYAPIEKYEQMKVEVDKKRVGTLFGGGFSIVIILHNPTLLNVFGMDWQKSKALELLEKGKDSEFIAQNLNVNKKDVDSFLKSQKPKGLSPVQKGKVKEMLDAGTPQTDEGLQSISKELDIELDRIKNYINSLQK